MAYKKRTLGITGVVLSLLWLAACTPWVSTSTPTLDVNPLRTEVAATVWVQVTQNLAQTPSATVMPSSTATRLPTSTQSPTASPSPDLTESLSSETPGVETVNQAQWVSQSVPDDTVFTPGESFTMSWRLKNTGTSTWTPGYLLRYYSGDTFGAPREISIGQEVPPGEEIEITVQMKAPTTQGNYRSDWVMSSESRSNFKEPVFLRIKVAVPATPTRTATPAS